MIPNSVFGLLVIATSLGPGYLFVRIAERRNPRPARSSLLELVELVAVGGSCFAVSALAALVVAEKTHKLDLHALATNGREYALTHPIPVFALFLGALAGSYVIAACATLLFHRGIPATLRQHSVWHQTLRRQQDSREPYVTIELRDGRVVAGPVAYYTVEDAPLECRELVLIKPVKLRPPQDSQFVELDDERVVLRASDMASMAVKYFTPT